MWFIEDAKSIDIWITHFAWHRYSLNRMNANHLIIFWFRYYWNKNWIKNYALEKAWHWHIINFWCTNGSSAIYFSFTIELVIPIISLFDYLFYFVFSLFAGKSKITEYLLLVYYYNRTIWTTSNVNGCKCTWIKLAKFFAKQESRWETTYKYCDEQERKRTKMINSCFIEH